MGQAGSLRKTSLFAPAAIYRWQDEKHCEKADTRSAQEMAKLELLLANGSLGAWLRRQSAILELRTAQLSARNNST